MRFKTLVKIIMRYCIDRSTAENIAQDILCYAYAEYEDIVFDKYSMYITEWYLTHNEGMPVCFEEWYNNEYMEKDKDD